MNPNLYGLQVIDGFSLRSCPFCGGESVVIRLPESFDEEFNFYADVCTVCSTAGKPFVLPVSAAKFWNERVSNLMHHSQRQQKSRPALSKTGRKTIIYFLYYNYTHFGKHDKWVKVCLRSLHW